MPVTKLNPVYCIKQLEKHIKKNYIYSESKNKEESDNAIDIANKISKILTTNYGEEIAEEYDTYKNCAKHLIYPISCVIEQETIDYHNKHKFDIMESVENYKDIIIIDIGHGGGIDTYNHMCNKIKFFRDSGFNMWPNTFITVPFDEMEERTMNNIMRITQRAINNE